MKDTDYEYFAQDDFRVRKPDIKIVMDGAPTAKQELSVVLRLTNPLPIALHKGLFYVEGTGLADQLVLKVPEIASGETGAVTFKYTPPWAGRGSLVAKFVSKELNDVDGHLAFEVKARPEDVILDNDVIGRPGYGDRREVLLDPYRPNEPRSVNEIRTNGNTNNASPRYIVRRNIEIENSY